MASTCVLPLVASRPNPSLRSSSKPLTQTKQQKVTHPAPRYSTICNGATASTGWTLQGTHEDGGWVKVNGCFDTTPRHNFHAASEHVFTTGKAIASACDGLAQEEIEVELYWCDDSIEVGGVPVCHGWSPDVGPIDLQKSTVPKGFSPA